MVAQAGRARARDQRGGCLLLFGPQDGARGPALLRDYSGCSQLSPLVALWLPEGLPAACSVRVHPTGSLPYEYKIVIAGNHELTFDQEFMADLIKQDFYYFPSVSKLKPENYENVQSLLTNCIYLQDSEVTVRGFRIYGSPW